MASLAHLSTTTLVSPLDATKHAAAKKTICCVAGPAPKDRAARVLCSKAFSSRAPSAWSVSRPDRAQRMMVCRAEVNTLSNVLYTIRAGGQFRATDAEWGSNHGKGVTMPVSV
eukprot:8796290-Pyramimonas_sp.AAC.1